MAPTFVGEKEEETQEWLLNMTKYFQAYRYERKLKGIFTIYQLHGKAALQWEEAKNMHMFEE